MNARILAIAGVAAVLGVIAAGVMAHRTHSPKLVPPKSQAERKAAPTPAPRPELVQNTLEDARRPEPVAVSTNVPPPATIPTPARVPDVTPPPDPRLADPVFKEQVGRYALSFVGADPMADAVWATLIYDTSLSDTVREDLMEDLNENGFSGGNGDVATVDDLPLIETRILLLEAHMDGADEFMLEHLGEAHKDLINMWTRLNRR